MIGVDRMTKFLEPTPWDKRTFNIETYELTASHEEALKATDEHEGHFTLKVDPLENPQKIIKHGFYYMDSLIKPVCQEQNFKPIQGDKVELSQNYNKREILAIAEEAFIHGRFHRDFNVSNSLANKRYMRWVADLMEENNLFSLLFDGELAGFYGFKDDKVLLLGIKRKFQGKGLAKPFTSMGCHRQFSSGYSMLHTSISAANVASLNLFYSLGFKLKKTVDVYHKLNGPPPHEVQ